MKVLTQVLLHLIICVFLWRGRCHIELVLQNFFKDFTHSSPLIYHLPSWISQFTDKVLESYFRPTLQFIFKQSDKDKSQVAAPEAKTVNQKHKIKVQTSIFRRLLYIICIIKYAECC